MKKIKLTANIVLGLCTMLVFNENAQAFALNLIGVASFALLLIINHECESSHHSN